MWELEGPWFDSPAPLAACLHILEQETKTQIVAVFMYHVASLDFHRASG